MILYELLNTLDIDPVTLTKRVLGVTLENTTASLDTTASSNVTETLLPVDSSTVVEEMPYGASDTTGDAVSAPESETISDAVIIEEVSVPCPDTYVIENEIVISPGCTGVIQGLQEWAQNAISSGAGIDTYPQGSVPDRLIEAMLSGNGSEVATDIAKEQGLFIPDAEKDSFNLYKDSIISMDQDGGLHIVNPNGSTAHTLWNQCDQNPYTGTRMIATGPCVPCTPEVVPVPEIIPEPEPVPLVAELPPEPEQPSVVEHPPIADNYSVWKQELLLGCVDNVCSNTAYGTVIVVQPEIANMSPKELLEKGREIAKIVPDGYQEVLNPEKRFIMLGDGRCISLYDGHVYRYDPNVGGPRSLIHELKPDQVDDYLRSTLDGESDVIPTPGEPLRLIPADIDGDGKADTLYQTDRSVDSTKFLTQHNAGHDIFGDKGGLVPGEDGYSDQVIENQRTWNKMLSLSLPEDLNPITNPDLTRDGFLEALDDYYDSEGIHLSKKELNDLAWYLSVYDTESAPGALGSPANIDNQNYTSFTRPDGSMKTLGEFLEDAAVEAKKQGDMY